MIDMHCHLLPSVDDGVKDFDEAINQIKEGIKNGVLDFIITPHYRPTKNYVRTTELLKNELMELQTKIQELGIEARLYLGREIDEVKDLKKLLEEQIVDAMNDTKYLLLDFGVNTANITEYIYETKLLGYKVIVAHVERYKYVDTLESFDALKKEGALLQMNASSIVSPRNKTMKKKVKYLLKNKLVDFVATDAHRNPESYSQFKKAYDYVSKKYGAEYALKVFETNPKFLIEHSIEL